MKIFLCDSSWWVFCTCVVQKCFADSHRWVYLHPKISLRWCQRTYRNLYDVLFRKNVGNVSYLTEFRVHQLMCTQNFSWFVLKMFHKNVSGVFNFGLWFTVCHLRLCTCTGIGPSVCIRTKQCQVKSLSPLPGNVVNVKTNYIHNSNSVNELTLTFQNYVYWYLYY